ncbi:MAG: hypothetical protein GF317_02345 [Candidatus Lokiarchaeota archaeon]|nr:hypothetical protein [Candidatus Lokiarchaeota archaeon]MBD3198748.1 hypothetical protein [Candidatus Lokiarchaeota archaeon]
MEISFENISYDKKSKILTIRVSDFSFVGHYRKSTRIKRVLDDLYDFLQSNVLERSNISIKNYQDQAIPEKTKLKDLDLKKFEERAESGEGESHKPSKARKKQKVRSRSTIRDLEELSDEESDSEKSSMYMNEKRERESAYPSSPPGGAPPAVPSEFPPPPPGAAKPATLSRDLETTMKSEDSILDEKIIYNINMALQYYSVMMEKRSYLLYVYFSHEELKIMDEEGKVIYQTTIKIETKKKEPPVLNLTVAGEGFEVHPLNGKVVVKKNAVNPPVMIFSIMPMKIKRDKSLKKKVQRRFLNITVEFEQEIISKTVLAVVIQPKHFQISLGPIHLNIGKSTAFLISIASVLIATFSFLYSIFTFGDAPDYIDTLSGIIPGIASLLFFLTYIISLVRGFYPLKQKWQNILNFDKFTPISK